MSIWNTSLLTYMLKMSGLLYKSPSNFNYHFNYGFLLFLFLMSQLLSGAVVAMFYTASAELAFGCVYDMVTEIYYGWFIRYLHTNGASFFFLFMYFHMLSGLYYGSFFYPSQAIWYSGAVIWLLLIATSFLGYILPWGQMSYWGAVVITSLVGAVPFVGEELMFLLWGDFNVDDVTLRRFWTLHYQLPYIILLATIAHIIFLHELGSNNPLGLSNFLDLIPFVTYYGVKDVFSAIVMFFFAVNFIFYYVDFFGHSDNYIVANSLVTPTHIVPEWYFLPLYAVLRSVTNKSFGIILIALFIACVFLIPFFCSSFIIRSTLFKPFYRFFVWSFLLVVLSLFWIGGLPVIDPYIIIGQLCTFLYFFIIMAGFPFCGFVESIVYRMYTNGISKKFWIV